MSGRGLQVRSRWGGRQGKDKMIKVDKGIGVKEKEQRSLLGLGICLIWRSLRIRNP